MEDASSEDKRFEERNYSNVDLQRAHFQFWFFILSIAMRKI